MSPSPKESQMKYLILPLALVLAGCSGGARATGTYAVDEQGNVMPVARSAVDAMPGTTGPQEIFGVALPLGPDFTLKGGLLWSGNPWTWPTPAPQRVVVPQAAAPCQTTYREETYVEYQPVQRTRMVPVKQVAIPVPQAAPQSACPEPVAQICPAPAWECANGACRVK